MPRNVLVPSFCLLLFSFMIVSTAAQTQPKPAADFPSLAHVFDYDLKQALDIHDKIIEEFSDGTLHDITYTSLRAGLSLRTWSCPRGKVHSPRYSSAIGAMEQEQNSA